MSHTRDSKGRFVPDLPWWRSYLVRGLLALAVVVVATVLVGLFR